MFPHLKNEFGMGIRSLEIKLKNKLKRLRQKDSSLEVSMVRKAYQESKNSTKIKQGKGILN